MVYIKDNDFIVLIEKCSKNSLKMRYMGEILLLK
jgi:hypothetical protein